MLALIAWSKTSKNYCLRPDELSPRANKVPSKVTPPSAHHRRFNTAHGVFVAEVSHAPGMPRDLPPFLAQLCRDARGGGSWAGDLGTTVVLISRRGSSKLALSPLGH